MNREQLITRIKSVIYQNDNNEIDAQKHQDLEIEIVNALLDAVANIAGGFLGTLRADAPAPTPQKNGYYIYSTAGNVSYIGGAPTVKIGDWLSVTYVGLNHNYINVDKILNLSNDYTVSNENVGASLKALHDGLSNLSRTIKEDTTSTVASVEDNLDVAIERIDDIDTAIKNIGRLCNITTESASTARSRVLSVFRRKGFQLERFDNLSNYITEKYIGATFEDSEWIKESNWLAYANANDIKRVDNEILKIGRFSTSASYTQANARLSVPLSNRKRNFELSYNNLDLGDTPRTEQYTGDNMSDTEWIKDSNWITLETKNNKNAANGYAGLDANKQLANELINTNFRKGFGYIFDGVDDYLSVDHNDKLNFGTDDFSIQVSFICNEITQPVRRLYEHRHTTIDSSYSVIILGGKITFVMRQNGVSQSLVSTNNITVGSYHNVFCIRKGLTLSIFDNGILIATSVIPESYNLNYTPSTRKISSNVGIEDFSGKIGLVRLFNRALSQSDVTYYENNGRPDLIRLQYSDVITDYGELMQFGDNEATLKGNPDFSLSTGLVGTYTRNNINPINGLYDARLQVTSAGTSNNKPIVVLPIINKAGKSYLLSFNAKINSGTAIISSIGKGNTVSATNKTLATGINKIIFDSTMPSNLSSFYLYFDGTQLFDVQLDDYSVKQLGCVLELLPENALQTQWLESQNSLNAITSGNPAINTETPVTDYAIVDNITNNIAVGTANRDYTLPAGYIVDSVCVNSTVALTALQLVNVTNSETLLTGKTVSASANKHLPITADQSSSKVDSTIRLNCVGNTGLGFNIVINIKKCL